MFTRLRRRTLVALVFAWVAAASVLAWLVFDGRRVALERGQRATAAFAAVVEQQTWRTFQAINLTLGAVTDARRLSPHREKNDPEFQDMMKRRLKDMLNIVALNVTLLRRRPDDPSVVERSLATLERAVRGGTQVVERLLSFARRRPLAITRVRLDTALEAARPLLAQAAGSRATGLLRDIREAAH